MSLDAFGYIFLVSGSIYMLTTMSLATGSPPFYVSGNPRRISRIEEKKYKDRLKTTILVTFLPAFSIPFFILIYSYSHWPIFLIMSGFFGFLAGTKNRALTFKEAKKPKEWVYDNFPALNMFITRYPFGLFDLYTIGLTLSSICIMMIIVGNI